MDQQNRYQVLSLAVQRVASFLRDEGTTDAKEDAPSLSFSGSEGGLRALQLPTRGIKHTHRERKSS